MLSSRLDILHLIATHSCLEFMIFFELMHQSCTAMVQGTEHRVSMLKFVRCLMDSASVQEPFLYAGLLQFPQTKMRNATFPPEKNVETWKWSKTTFSDRYFFFFLLECKSILTHSPHPLLSAGLETLEKSPSGFKQSNNGHKRGKHSSIHSLLTHWLWQKSQMTLSKAVDAYNVGM